MIFFYKPFFIEFDKRPFDLTDKINDLLNKERAEREEILYFRKYYELNDALKEKLLNFDNGACLQLTKEDMIFIKDFIKKMIKKIQKSQFNKGKR